MRRSTPTATLVAGLLVAACTATPTLAPAPESEREQPPADAATPAAPGTAAPAPAPARARAATLRGKISHYGDAFAGKKTASGDIFDPQALTMAHRTLPFGTRVRVTNLENHRSVEVVVNDRGPMVPGRVADLSLAAARQLGMLADGVVDALLEIVSPGSGR